MKDKELISSILSLDVSKFYSTLERYTVNACGYEAIGTIMKDERTRCDEGFLELAV